MRARCGSVGARCILSRENVRMMTSPPTSLRRNCRYDHDPMVASDVSEGLRRQPRELPPKYFYDERGSRLFEAICDLPEYYQTRTERSILDRVAMDLVRAVGTGEIVELGAGNASKTRALLQAAHTHGLNAVYTPIDISVDTLEETARALRSDYQWLVVEPLVVDFTRSLPIPLSRQPRLILFLGGSIGNFSVVEAPAFLRRVAAAMNGHDHYIMGVDLVKDPALLHAAYNDSAGVTARFNLNILRVINRELGGDFRLDRFRHYAFYNPEHEQIEMHLASLDDQSVRIEALMTDFAFARGETVRTEISRKFSRASVEALLQQSGLDLVEFHTDPLRLFALCVARRRDAEVEGWRHP